MTRWIVAPVLAATMLAGCTRYFGEEPVVTEPPPEQRLVYALQAYERGRYLAARQELSWLVEAYPDTPASRQAAVVLTALELDPRNPARRLDAGAKQAAQALRQRELTSAERAATETLYLLALELGAAPVAVDTARADTAAAPLPVFQGKPYPARLAEVTEQRDKLRQRAAALEQQVAELQKEIERIRRTIKP